MREPVGRDAADTAVVLADGTPVTHGELAHGALAVVGLYGLGPRTVTLGALPLSEPFGQTCSLSATILAGGCLTLLPRFDAGHALAVIARERVTAFHGTPEMYAAMLAHPEHEAFDLSTLVHVVTTRAGGESLERVLGVS